MKKGVLDHVLDFASWHASQQNSVDEWRVELVQICKLVAIPGENHADQLNVGRLVPQFNGFGFRRSRRACAEVSFDRSFSLTGHYKRVRCGFEFIHCAVSFGVRRSSSLICLTPIKTGETGRVLTGFRSAFPRTN